MWYLLLLPHQSLDCADTEYAIIRIYNRLQLRIITPDDGIIYRNIYIEFFFFVILSLANESSIFINIMYHIELTPKSYELNLQLDYSRSTRD
jgi:hypothetical protein